MKLPLTYLIDCLSPAHAHHKLEILFSECPMGCNEYCIFNFGIRFSHISMPLVLFDERGETQIAKYNQVKILQKTTNLGDLSHLRTLKVLRHATHIRKREQHLTKAMNDCEVHAEFVDKILNNRIRNRYFRNFFCDVLPKDGRFAIPILDKQHCIDHLVELDCFIKQMQAACRRRKEFLQRHVKTWARVQGIPCWWIYDYYPLGKGDDDPKVWQVRKLIWDFKASGQHGEKMEERIQKNRESAKQVVQALSRYLRTCFGEDLHRLTLVCTPASNQETHELRYKEFSALLCEETGMVNAYEYIKVHKDGQAKHTGGEQQARLFVHPLYIRNQFVLIFDDVITKGNTLAKFKALLEHHGAHVVCACSIGRTVKSYIHTKDFNAEKK